MQRYNLLIVWIMMMAFGLVAVMPKGFMPGVDAQGKIAVVICSGLTQKTVYIDQEEGSTAPAPDSGTDDTQQGDGSDEPPMDSCPVTIVQKTLPIMPTLPVIAVTDMAIDKVMASSDSSDGYGITQHAHSRAPPFYS